MRLRSLITGLLLAFPLLAAGQSSLPLSLNFSRQNDFTWVSNADFTHVFSKGKYSLEAFVHHDQILNTSLEQNQFVQQYVKSSLAHFLRLSKKTEAMLWTETDQYISTSNQKIAVYGGVRYRPAEFLTISPMAGYTWDTRSGTLDQGFSPALQVKAMKDLGDGLSYYGRLFLRYKFIDPRRQYNAQMEHLVSKQFGTFAKLAAGIRTVSNELDDYSGTMVKRILSDTLSPSLELMYQLTPALSWESQNHFLLSRRRFRFSALPDGQLSENNLSFVGLEFDLMQRLSGVWKNFRASAAYQFQYTSRNYDLTNDIGMNNTEFQNQVNREKEKDFLRQLHKVDVQGDWQFARRHRLSGRFGSQYVQYDTPSETNFDDRDELTYVGGLEWSTQWRRGFSSGFGLSGNYRHYAFLFAEKSQDNYIQRGLRADFKFHWMLTRALVVDAQQSVYVTYNVKDFEDFSRTDRSTRNLETNLKCNWQPAQRLVVKASVNRKEMHQSYLNWLMFSETTLDTTQFLTAEATMRYRLHEQQGKNQWFGETGYRHFAQIRQQGALMVGTDQVLYPISLKQILLRTGPLAGVSMQSRKGSQLELMLWMQIQVKRFRYELRDEAKPLSQTWRQEELNSVLKSLEPYPTLMINYRF